jgi:hypothetical protein
MNFTDAERIKVYGKIELSDNLCHHDPPTPKKEFSWFILTSTAKDAEEGDINNLQGI